MNLNDLKPAWRQFLLFNSLEPMNQREVLSIIDGADRQTTRRLTGVMTMIMFIVLTACCQGG